MDLSNNVVLVTGGASGIGFGLAQIFSNAGSKVIVCGRRKSALDEARQKIPALITKQCDVSIESERLSLADWALENHPEINILINNAGIQERIQISSDNFWEKSVEEISVNLKAPLHLSSLFLPQLKISGHGAIVNVTSGLAFVPMAFAPVYCATKAALHSFTLSLRVQLKSSEVQVIEIIPPAVNTDLGGKGQHTFGVPLDEYMTSVADQLKNGDIEITYGQSRDLSIASRDEMNQAFQRLNQL